MKKLLDVSTWDHPLMFLVFLVLAAIPIGFVLWKVSDATGFAPLAHATTMFSSAG